MSKSTTPRIAHNGETVGYGWHLSDLLHEEAEYTEGELSFHPDDLSMVVLKYQTKIDRIQADTLGKIVNADLHRYIIYILKFLELMSAELGIRKLTDSIILGHEAGDDPQDQQELAQVWSDRATAWLDAIGRTERAGSDAKKAIAAAQNDTQMQRIVDGFEEAMSQWLTA